MDALGAKLACQRLHEGTSRELADCEGGEVRGCFERGRCAGEYQRWWVFRRGIRGFEEERENRLAEVEAAFAVRCEFGDWC